MSTLSAGVKEDGIERGLDALFTEALRVEKFGFTATELDRVKRNIMRGLERAVAEKDNTPSSSLADEYVRNFTDKEPSPGIEYEMGAARAIPAGDHAGRSERLAKAVGARQKPRRDGECARKRPASRCRIEAKLADGDRVRGEEGV